MSGSNPPSGASCISWPFVGLSFSSQWPSSNPVDFWDFPIVFAPPLCCFWNSAKASVDWRKGLLSFHFPAHPYLPWRQLCSQLHSELFLSAPFLSFILQYLELFFSIFTLVIFHTFPKQTQWLCLRGSLVICGSVWVLLFSHLIYVSQTSPCKSGRWGRGASFDYISENLQLEFRNETTPVSLEKGRHLTCNEQS